MTTLRILPEILSNQIAAGEVVQRPASVVKELVENAIDAGATSITIDIAKGGKSLVRVSDNGIGLSRDDALLSIERYATSKLFTKEDLFSISTMGFRGEALPSIASVSKFTLVTRTAASAIGTRIEIAGGRVNQVSDTGAPVGTMVEVRHLFFNTPARKKFLKSDATETGHIADAISGMALGNPEIQFRLFLNGTLQKSFSASDDLFQRAVQVLGRDLAGKLYELDFSDAAFRIHGYCSNPQVTRSTSSKIFLFVNNRLVYDRGLISAIFQGYRGRIMKGRFPMGVFFVDIAFDQVDVNVHPTKREIKFFDGQQVYQAMARTVSTALVRAQQDRTAYSQMPAAPDRVRENPIETNEFLEKKISPEQTGRVQQAVMDWQTSAFPVPKNTDSAEKREINVQPSQELPDSIQIIGQAMGTYILLETRDGLMLMDQHAAHERIVYERLKKRHASLGVQSQTLMVPETLELSFTEANLLSELLADLRAVGIDIEPFGGTTFVVKAVPSIIDEQAISPIILDILEAALVKKNRFSKEAWLENCLILMACHGAIRANLRLGPDEMRALLTDLENCDNPRHCPHGRPIMITWKKHEIEKLFKRLV